MRMKLIMASILVPIVLIATTGSDDAQLKQILKCATKYEDNPHASWGEVRYAIRCADGNTNRVVSLMKQLIEEESEDEGTKMFYLSEIGKYGTSSDIPFLYQRVASTNLCEIATMAVLQIAGISTSSVTRICALLPCGNPTNKCVVSAWITLGAEAGEDGVDSLARNMMISNAVEYASRQNVYADRIDRSIMRLDPSYRMSRRRLATMRAIASLGVHPSRTNYVNNAITELVAFPEANLPE